MDDTPSCSLALRLLRLLVDFIRAVWERVPSQPGTRYTHNRVRIWKLVWERETYDRRE